MTPVAAIFLASGVALGLEAVYVIRRTVRRPERLAGFAFIVAVAMLFTGLGFNSLYPAEQSAAGRHMISISIGLVPVLWLVLCSAWGRDISDGRWIRYHRAAWIMTLAIGVVVTASAYNLAMPEGQSRELLLSSELIGRSRVFFVTLFYLMTFLFGLYHVENCYRTAVGTQRRTLLGGALSVGMITALTFFVLTLVILSGQLSEAIVASLAPGFPLVFLPLVLQLDRLDTTTAGVVVTRRSAHASTVMILGGLYFALIALLSMLLGSSGYSSIMLTGLVAASLALLLMASILLTHVFRGRRLPTEESREIDRYREFIADISLNNSVEQIVDRLRVHLRSQYGIDSGALIQFHGDQSVQCVSFDRQSIDLQSDQMRPVRDWMFRYGRPIVFGDLVERTGDMEVDCSFLAERLGFEPWIVMPVISRQELLALAVIGASGARDVSTTSISLFLETIAGPLALAVHNSRVTEELVKAREMESFHKISSFVLHDLKNSVGMLDLLLANARKNMDKPEFRATILTTIGDAVVRQRRIMSKLSGASTDEQLSIGPLDINSILQQVVAKTQVDKIERITLTERYGELPNISGDRRRLASVFENLIVNAIEAMPTGGSLTVSTQHVDMEGMPAKIIVEVSDTGVGMSPEFVRDKLFRPFTSTKKKGLGIGMFQSSEIVRQSGGEISVKSELRKGTVMEVILAV